MKLSIDQLKHCASVFLDLEYQLYSNMLLCIITCWVVAVAVEYSNKYLNIVYYSIYSMPGQSLVSPLDSAQLKAH